MMKIVSKTTELCYLTAGVVAGKLLLCSFGGGSNQWQSQSLLCTVSSARDIDNSCSAVIMFTTNTVRVLDSLAPPLHQSYGQFPMVVLDQWTELVVKEGVVELSTKWESSWGQDRMIFLNFISPHLSSPLYRILISLQHTASTTQPLILVLQSIICSIYIYLYLLETQDNTGSSGSNY